ncbi:MAG: hypothetical protein Q4A06_02615 [Cardiobacteriaceae bacterium]|nr:hypothetical protein [Cardiobacteriaceae bacterium]
MGEKVLELFKVFVEAGHATAHQMIADGLDNLAADFELDTGKTIKISIEVVDTEDEDF